MLTDLLELPSSGDLCSLTFVAMVLIYLGQLCVGKHPAGVWGPRLAILAFLLWVGGELFDRGVPTGAELAGIVLEGLVAAGLILGLAWILLGLVVSIFGALGQRVRAWLDKRRYAARRRREERRERARRKAEQKAWERSAPDREREQHEREERQKQEAKDKADAGRRRADKKLQCELFYDQHVLVLRDRFPKDRLDAYIEQYFGQEHPPELVEERGELLLRMLKECLEETGPPKRRFRSLDEIAQHYAMLRSEINGSDLYDPETKDTILRTLNLQQDQAFEEFFHS